MVTTSGYRAMLEGCAVANVPASICLFFKGDDTLEWLQGQITQDVSGMVPGDWRETCICSATGQIQSVGTLSHLKDCIALTIPAGTEDVILERVENSVFMEDVQVELCPSEWHALLVQGPKSSDATGFPLGKAEYLPEGNGFFQPTPNAREGFLIWGASDDVVIDKLKRELPQSTSEEFEALRLESGMPLWGKDISEKALPPEFGEAFLKRTASYSKGCYIGQEVLMRIHSRGHTNKSWVGLLCDAEVRPGVAVSSALRENSGIVTSAAISPNFGPIAAAMLHNDVAVSSETVSIEGVNAQIRPMPIRA